MRASRARRRAAQARWATHREWIRANRIRTKPEHDYTLGPGVVLLFHGTDPAHCVCNGTHSSRVCVRCP